MPRAHDDLILQVLEETLDTVLSPVVRDAVLQRSLSEYDLSRLPRDQESLRDFFEGPLRLNLARALGPELGNSVVVELSSLVTKVPRLPSTLPPPRLARSSPSHAAAPAQSRRSAPQRGAPPPRRSFSPRPVSYRPVRPKSIPPVLSPLELPDVDELSQLPTSRLHEPTLPPPGKPPTVVSRPPSSTGYPVGTARALGVIGAAPSDAPASETPAVLIATEDEALFQRITLWLDPRAIPQRVVGLMDLMRALDLEQQGRRVILLDCRSPSVRPQALAALASDLPSDVEVVLWGATSAIETRVRAIAPETRRWFVVGAESNLEQIAKRCSDLTR